ncbi:alpha/beta-hydrolase [Daldinia caldariorum]|uniref:alpha/beta-hydrolase n=1 Tax=Daldinia caldariorum TaxID=326644 RepID=UPI00200854D8|nr:alpha/beta-hydrolase [Daldinia caldariorum]KAI1472995.1 alpha/beta-hydrolase [Daldinia caldariorum]
MDYEYYTANDGCTLAFQTSLPIGAKAVRETRYERCILLMHGFSGSSTYFTNNFEELSREHCVVAPDMRGHGRSGRPLGGYHVARLAADLRGLVAHLRKSVNTVESVKIVPVGCSIGAAVLWTYVELFGCDDFSGFVFVDQGPLQDRSPFGNWDASKSHLGCYDEQTMQAAQREWIHSSANAHKDLVQSCLGYRHAPEPDTDDLSDERRQRDEEFFTRISAQCDQTWLAKLLADHTRYDHREAIADIVLPTLVMAGRRTGCFPLEGMKETVRQIESKRPGTAKMSIFYSGHWLFYEEPERFNKEITEFANACFR